jgi:hypothetical protein
MFALFLLGRCSVAAAMEGRTRSLSRARQAAGRIERTRAAWAAGFSDIIRAGVAAVEGRPEAAWARLNTVRIGLVVAEMHPWAAAISYWQARRQGAGDLPSDSDWCSRQDVRNPDRLAAMLVPGVERSVRRPSGGG